MEYKTTAFGVINVEDDAVLTIKNGLLGFPNLTKYVFLRHPELEHVKWLQSLENEYIHFLLLSPFSVDPDYQIEFDDNIKKELDCSGPGEIAVFCIAVVPEDVNNSTLNMKAPLLLNFVKGKGMQIIVEKEEYSTKKPILENQL